MHEIFRLFIFSIFSVDSIISPSNEIIFEIKYKISIFRETA